MEIKLVQEWKAYTRDEFAGLLNLEGRKLSDAARELRKLNILKCTSISKVKDLSILMDESTLFSFSENYKDIYYFQYVGILKVGDNYLFVYPKYLKECTYIKDRSLGYPLFKLILQVIEQYNYKEQQQISDNSEKSEFINMLSVAIQLLNDYIQNGLYESEQNIIEVNGEGQILWNQTISMSDAYIIEDTPIYFDWFTLNQENNINNFFYRLHRIVLTLICVEFQEIFSILNITPVFLSEESITTLGDIDYIINRINQELSVQFRSDRQNILKLLKDYLLESKSNNLSDEISFIGTNSFNLVWQDVCAVIKKNCLDKKLFELGYTYKNMIQKRTCLKNIIDKPEWRQKDSDQYDTTNTLMPDIVTFENHNLVIYDAKYYNTSFDDKGNISNVPGIESLTKQILYELAYRDFATENNMVIAKNSFLMPTEGTEDYILGTGSLGLLKNHTNGDINDITIEMIAAEKAFHQYLK